MKTKKWAISITTAIAALLIIVSVALMGCQPATTPNGQPSEPTPASPAVFNWKMQAEWPRGDISLDVAEKFVALVDENSDGRLKIQLFAEPEIVTWDQVIDATRQGTLDMMMGAGPIATSIVPVGDVEFGLPFSLQVIPVINTEDEYLEACKMLRSWYFESGFVDLLRTEYGKYGLYWLDMHSYGPQFILLAKRPVVTIDDLKGMKVRADGVWSELLNMAGAVGTSDVGPTDVYVAVQRGTLDGITWDVGAVTGLKWNEVAPYWVKGWENSSGWGHFQVNADKWNSLPDDLKVVLTDAADETANLMAERYGQDLQIMLDMSTEGTLKTSTLDTNAVTVLREKAQIIWDEVAKRDEACAKAVALVKELQKSFEQ